MASISGLTIPTTNTVFSGGAAFKLSEPAKYSFLWQTPNGSICEMESNKVWVTVALLAYQADFDVLLPNAYEEAQKFLDVVAVKNRTFYALPSAHKDHILWHRQDGKVCLRLANSMLYKMDILSGSTTKVNGIVQNPPAPPPVIYNEAMRYLRYSKIRNDVYVSFRDAYLSLECLFDQLYPIQSKPKEKEFDWLVRGCRDLELQGVNFSQFFPASVVSDAVEEFVKYVYSTNRTAVFHAKFSRTHFVPGNLIDRKNVTECLEFLHRFLIDLLHRNYAPGTSFPVLTMNFFNNKIKRQNFILAVSEDISPSTDEKLSSQGLPVTCLDTAYLGVMDGLGYEHGFLGSIEISAMKSTLINIVGAQEPNGDLICSEHVEALDLTDIDDFEYKFLWQYSQRADLRTDFDL